MNKFVLIFAVLFLSANAFADEGDQVITLKDGSQIKGQLSGIENGIYTVKTPIIGNVHVAAADVASITNGNAVAAAAQTQIPQSMPTAAGTLPSNDQIALSQQRMMANPQSMAILKEMMQDPQVMQLIEDPTLVQAVTSHDYEAVKDNPNVQKLISNPKIQALLQQLAATQQQQQNTSSQ